MPSDTRLLSFGQGTRWHSMVGCMVASSITGLIYAYGDYSDALKQKFGFSQDQVESLATLSSCGAAGAFLLGLLSDRYGTQITVLFCGVGCCLALTCYWALAREFLLPPQGLTAYSAMLMATFGATLFSSGITTATFSMLVQNFPEQKGLVVGACKAWVGISSGLATVLYVGLVGPLGDGPATINFVLFTAGMTAVGWVLPFPWFVVHPPPAELVDGGGPPPASPAPSGPGPGPAPKLSIERKIVASYAFTAVEMVLITLAAVVPMRSGDPGATTLAVLAAVVWLSLLLIPTIPSAGPRSAAGDGPGPSSCAEPYPPAAAVDPRPLLPAAREPLGSGEGEGGAGAGAADGERGEAGMGGGTDALPQMNSLQMMRTWQYWLLLYCITSVYGGGLMVISNLGQMCSARRITHSSGVVQLCSVGQCIGRLSAGVVSECGMRRRISRLWMVVGLGALMVLAHALLMLPLTSAWKLELQLYVGTFLAGIAFGGLPPCNVIIANEMYGSKHMGSNYPLLEGVACLLGQFIFAKLLTQSVYNRALHRHHMHAGHVTDEAGTDCYGVDCFAITHLVVVCFCVSAILGSYFLVRSTMPLYRKLWDLYNK